MMALRFEIPAQFARDAIARDVQERLAVVVSTGDLDRDRARGWAYVRVVEFWLRALKAVLTEDPAKCEALAEWL